MLLTKTAEPDIHVPASASVNREVYYSQLDGLRCFAVIGVLFQHFVTPFVSHYFLTGRAGVDLFFVISGFLITGNLIKLKAAHNFSTAAKVFYVRRVLRIFPLYFFYLALIGVVFFPLVKTSLPYAFTYTINFFDIDHDLHALVGHLWSLSVEEQFYIFWPFIILLVSSKHLKNLVIGTWIFAFVFIMINIGKRSEFDYFHTLSCMVALSSGAILAWYNQFNPDRVKSFLAQFRKGWFLLCVVLYFAIAAGFQMHKVSDHLLILMRLIMCFVGVYLVGMVTTGKGFKRLAGRVLDNKVIRQIGQVSYGVYIYHYLVAFLCLPYLAKMFDEMPVTGLLKYIKFNHTFIEFPVLTALTVGLALLSYYSFEAPILRLKRHFRVGKQPQVAAHPDAQQV